MNTAELPPPTKPTPLAKQGLEFLADGGEMGARIAAFDWSATPLGPLQQWPQSLRTSVSLILSSRHPMWIGWGEGMTFLYNDAYVSVLSLAKHPWALGRPAMEVWAEIWHVCGPLADDVFQRGESAFDDEIQLFMKRGDFLEETYYSFSYSPIRDEAGKIGGLFCPSAEVSSKVINTRRLATLSELAAKSLVERTVESAYKTAFATLAKNFADLPFALFYLIDWDAGVARRVAANGVLTRVEAGLPREQSLEETGAPGPLALAQVALAGRPELVSVAGLESLPLGPAQQPIREAYVLPVVARTNERPLGVFVAGLNPTRRFDAEYRTFCELITAQVATAIQSALAAEEDRRKAEELVELDRAKTAFFNNVSHEFRTPLTLMLGPLEEEMRRSAQPNERLELAHRNSLRLLKLVNTLLDFSRIEAGKAEAVFEETDLAAYTAELASVFRSTTDKAGLRLAVDCPPLREPVYVDREMWEKIVFNLISNAFKFTFEGGIEVRLRRDEEGNVRLSVRDTGVGIPAAEIPKLFERFHRVRKTRSRSFEGTGIGLALVHELVRLHGGTVEVQSIEGTGTTFIVTLPTGAAHLPRERVREARQLSAPGAPAMAYVEEAARWLPDDKLPGDEVAESEMDAIRALPASTVSRGRPRILLADDNSDMRDYVRRLLAARGFEVEAVGDGQAALAAVRKHAPALVVSDVMMPQLDGFGLLRELRADAATRTIPIILLSARAGEEARIDGATAGADDYLVKPFSARELIARVETHLELARVRRESAAIIESERQRLHDLIMHAPAIIMVLRGPDHRLELANDRWLASAGKAGVEPWLGKPLRTILPELEEQGYLAKLDRVFATGERHAETEARVLIRPLKDELPREVFANYVYQPTRGPDGAVDGIFVHAVDVSEQVRAHREVAQLAGGLTEANALLADRAAQLEELVQQRTTKLRETVGELESFSYSIAHDLRSPLRSLQGFSEVLLTEYCAQLEPDAQGFLRRIGSSAGRMDKLIQDVLNYSRVVRADLALETVDLDRLVRDIVDSYPMFATDKVDIEVAHPLPRVLGNEAMFTQIFSNLMGNALKFVAPGVRPQLWVTSRVADGRAHIEIRDNGIGIPADQHDRIFGIFHQVDKSYGGTGIGLAIVKKAVERMGGKIGLRSAPGEGSTFWFEVRQA